MRHHFLPAWETCFTSPSNKHNESIQIVPGSGPFDEIGGEFLPDSRPIPVASADCFSRENAETLVGGAPVSIKALNDSLKRAPRLAAADGGANTVLSAGLRPNRVVGDMDSISEAAKAAFRDVLHPIAEQDSTDFAKALRTGPGGLTIAVGFVGARVDHFLSCLTEMGRRAALGAAPVVLLGEIDCVTILPPQARLRLPLGTRVSLWPLAPAEGHSDGLTWPLTGVPLSPTERTGTSNCTDQPEVRITMAGGPVALILPADQLDAMLTMLEIAPRGGEEGAL